MQTILKNTKIIKQQFLLETITILFKFTKMITKHEFNLQN